MVIEKRRCIVYKAPPSLIKRTRLAAIGIVNDYEERAALQREIDEIYRQSGCEEISPPPNEHWISKNEDKYKDTHDGLIGQEMLNTLIRKASPADFLDKIRFSDLYNSDRASLPWWDSNIGGITVDSKIIAPGSDICRVKRREFKNMDLYVFIKQWSLEEYSFIGMATGAQVKKSILNEKLPYAPAYELQVSELSPIQIPTGDGRWIIIQ